LPEYLSGREFLERYGDIADTITRVQPDRSYPVRQATAHPIHENDRVAQFANLLGSLPQRPDAAIEIGQLMRESHASYNACGLGSAGTDRLVELVTEAGADSGLFGAKITGGGSGGTVAIFGTAAAQPLVHEIAARYSAQTERASTVFAASGPSAGETGVLVVEAIAS
jgi:L-arabinokinase